MDLSLKSNYESRIDQIRSFVCFLVANINVATLLGLIIEIVFN